MKKKVVVIIVTYNGSQWLKKCLHSLENAVFSVDVIAIDNASTDNSVEILQQFSFVDLVLSKVNLGFGKANNLGIQKALQLDYDYFFLLNQDTWIEPDAIQNLVEVAQKNPDFGIISPLHFSSDTKTLDTNFEVNWNRKIKSISKNIDEVPFVNAAAWLLPKAVIEKVGYFEPLFNHYGEDRNYADRVQYHQFKSVVVKTAKIYHDRIITTNFEKHCKQAKYQILAAVLNINYSLFGAYLFGFRSVFGLPKYYFKKYSFSQVFKMLWQLLGYFILLKIHIITILKARNSYT